MTSSARLFIFIHTSNAHSRQIWKYLRHPKRFSPFTDIPRYTRHETQSWKNFALLFISPNLSIWWHKRVPMCNMAEKIIYIHHVDKNWSCHKTWVVSLTSLDVAKNMQKSINAEHIVPRQDQQKVLPTLNSYSHIWSFKWKTRDIFWLTFMCSVMKQTRVTQQPK